MANGIATFSFLDDSTERSSMSMQIDPVTALNLGDILSWYGDIKTSLAGVTLGTIAAEKLAVFETRLSNALPGANAQRELKWLVSGEDTTQYFDPPTNAIPNEGFGKVFTFTIPTADPSVSMLTGTDLADLAQAEWAALTADIESYWRSPHGGAMSVLTVRLVGRNL